MSSTSAGKTSLSAIVVRVAVGVCLIGGLWFGVVRLSNTDGDHMVVPDTVQSIEQKIAKVQGDPTMPQPAKDIIIGQLRGNEQQLQQRTAAEARK